MEQGDGKADGKGRELGLDIVSIADGLEMWRVRKVIAWAS